MADKRETDSQTVKLLGIERDTSGNGFCQAFSLSEFEIPKAIFMKHCKRITRTEPDQFAVLNMHLTKKARELLGI